MMRAFRASGSMQKPNKLSIRFSDSDSDNYDEYSNEEAVVDKKSTKKIAAKPINDSKKELYSYSSYTEESSSSIPFNNQDNNKKSKDSRRTQKLVDYDSDISENNSQHQQAFDENEKVNYVTSSSNSASQNSSMATAKSEPLYPTSTNLPSLSSKLPQVASTLRLLDRYKSTTSKFSQFFGDQTVTYTLYRKKIWKKSRKS